MSTRIKVGVRLRPFIDQEKKQGYKNTKILPIKDKNEIQFMLDNTNSRMFKFDHILDSVTSQ